MKPIEWNKDKNEKLKLKRKISFEEIANLVETGKIVTVIKHPNQKIYPNQFMYICNINNYMYVVPFIEDSSKIFLKTIYPSRKYNKIYSKKEKYDRP